MLRNRHILNLYKFSKQINAAKMTRTLKDVCNIATCFGLNESCLCLYLLYFQIVYNMEYHLLSDYRSQIYYSCNSCDIPCLKLEFLKIYNAVFHFNICYYSSV
jgi:hypothetical protein